MMSSRSLLAHARQIIFFGSITSLCLAPAEAQVVADADQEWRRFHYPEAPASFEFPQSVFPVEREGNRGIVFTTRDGRAAIRAFAIQNPKRLPPRNYLRTISNPDAPFSYVRATNRFFVASGSQAGTIVYRRCNFSRDLTHAGCFQLNYPADEKRAWDRVVTRMSLSLRVRR